MAELLGRQNNVGFQYYGPKLMKSRKVLNASLNSHAVHSRWAEFLDQMSLELLRALHEHPGRFMEDIHK